MNKTGFNETDNQHTDEVVCPYCGHEHMDSWAFGGPETEEGGGDIECVNCDETFYFKRHITVTYSTQKKV